MTGTWGRLTGGLATLSAVTVLLAACGTSEAAPSGRAPGEHACSLPGGAEQFHEPRVVPLESDSHVGTPGALAERVEIDALEDQARSGPSRDEAEQFALLFAQAVLDSREEVDSQRLVDALMAEEAPQAACQHVLGRLPAMRETGWGTYVVPGATAWVRSRADGDAVAPSHVEMELITTIDLENDPGWFGVEGEPLVFLVRVDVVRAGPVWLVADWQGPEAAGLEPGERPRKSHGVGWRSWEPGVG